MKKPLKKDQPCTNHAKCGRIVGPRGAKGLCPACYQAAKNAAIKLNPLTCEVPDCGQDVIHAGHKICAMHRARLRREGSVGESGRRNGRFGEWHLGPKGYMIQRIDGKYVLQHRYVMAEILGRPLETYEHVHHKNGQRADNDPSNLELWVRPAKAIGGQPFGQRVDDLVAWIVETYPDRVIAALAARTAQEAESVLL